MLSCTRVSLTRKTRKNTRSFSHTHTPALDSARAHSCTTSAHLKHVDSRLSFSQRANNSGSTNQNGTSESVQSAAPISSDAAYVQPTIISFTRETSFSRVFTVEDTMKLQLTCVVSSYIFLTTLTGEMKATRVRSISCDKLRERPYQQVKSQQTFQFDFDRLRQFI